MDEPVLALTADQALEIFRRRPEVRDCAQFKYTHRHAFFVLAECVECVYSLSSNKLRISCGGLVGAKDC